jgi:hypothetical protein
VAHADGRVIYQAQQGSPGCFQAKTKGKVAATTPISIKGKGNPSALQLITTDCHDGHKETHTAGHDENDIGQRPTKFDRPFVSNVKHATVQLCLETAQGGKCVVPERRCPTCGGKPQQG